MSPAPRIAIHGEPRPYLVKAIKDGGAELVEAAADPDAIMLDHTNDNEALKDVLDAAPSVRWVQLPYAGIEKFTRALEAHPGLDWTSAKGAYAQPVAEHALGLAIAVNRRLKERAAARSWGAPGGTSLYGLRAVVIGAGGVGLEIVRLLNALHMTVDVVRRTAAPAEGAHSTVTPDGLAALLPQADLVVVAAALTGDTRHLLGAEQFAAMKDGASLVNIARGGLVDTDALLGALRSGKLLGAGLDVTDPEPLTDGHPLWDEPRALITPHTADTMDMIRPLLGARVTRNLRRFAAGEELEGRVDAAAGY